MFKTFVADSLLTIPLTFLAIVFFTFVFALNPSFASAQADPPEDQPLDSTIYCPHITQTLIRGDCDEGLNRDWCLRYVPNHQVTELQHFLSDYYDIEPEDIMTGYFGNLTKRTVQRFQREQGLPSFGIVGPLTRAAIARVCGNIQSQNLSCTFNNQTVPHNQSVIAYQFSEVLYESQCVPQTRRCNNGSLSGSYQYQTCRALNTPPPQDTCTPEAPQTQTLSCPTGQTGFITQTRTSSCPGPTWGAWVTTSNTCATPPANVQPPTVSLLINGQQNITLAPNAIFTVAWSSSNATSCNLTNAQGTTGSTPPNTSASNQGAAPAAGTTWTYKLACTNVGGTTTKTATVTGQTTAPPPPPPPPVGGGGGGGIKSGAGTVSAFPFDGRASLLVLLYTMVAPNIGGVFPTFDFGDGSSHTPTGDSSLGFAKVEHTYATPGLYTVKTSGASEPLSTITIRVLPSTASNVGACSYKGSSVPEGTWKRGGGGSRDVLCDNGVWIGANAWLSFSSNQWVETAGKNICDNWSFDNVGEFYRDLGCTGPVGYPQSRAEFAVYPRHNSAAPLAVVVAASPNVVGTYPLPCPNPSVISWGDGTSEEIFRSGQSLCQTARYPVTHTYATAGSYTITYTDKDGRTNSANIRVDPSGVALNSTGQAAAGTAPLRPGSGQAAQNQLRNQSQLANALSVLESALKAFLKLLGQ